MRGFPFPMESPKSIMNMSRGRRVTSNPLIHGVMTSEFGLACGFGRVSIGTASL